MMRVGSAIKAKKMSDNSSKELAVEDIQLLADVRALLQIFSSLVDSVSTLKKWMQQSEVWWKIILRSVLRRQYEGMETIVELVERGQGHSCVPLLRPACEELLWIKFLRKINENDRELIIQGKAVLESGDSIEAQQRYLGNVGMSNLGFNSKYIAEARKKTEHAQRSIKKLGERLNWKSRGLFPATAEIARAVGEKELYDLIFHATSRTVHFSVNELFRRGWSKPNSDDLTITSKAMNRYWSRFALFWGARVMALTSAEIFEELSEDDWPQGLDKSTVDAVSELLARIVGSGYVPIITAKELNLRRPPEKQPKS
jgi:hypothetical protein